MTAPRVLILCASLDRPSPQTLAALAASGYPYDLILNVSDTALARNITLQVAVERIDSFDVLLMIDDDIVPPVGSIRQLCGAAYDQQEPCSGVYVSGDGHLTAYQIGVNGGGRRWVTGLGFLAIPVAHLRGLHDRSEQLAPTQSRPEGVREYCWSGAGTFPLDGLDEPRRWLSEDYRLTLRLGGVRLLPVVVGHEKSRVLYPSSDSVRELFERTP